MDTTFLTLGLALIVIGLLLLVVDLFIVSGTLAALALATVAVGVVFVFRYDTTVGVITTAALFLGVPLGGWALIRVFPGLATWRRGRECGPDTAGGLPIYKELALLRGKYGKTISALRPSGVVDFDGHRVDCLSEGMMIEPGRWVRCVDVQVGKVIVRAADMPNLDNMDHITLD